MKTINPKPYSKWLTLLLLSASLCISNAAAKNDKTPPGQDKKDDSDTDTDTGTDTDTDTDTGTGTDTGTDTGSDTGTDTDTGSKKDDKDDKKSSTLIGTGATKSKPLKVYKSGGWNVDKDYTVDGHIILVIDGDFNIGNNTIDFSSNGSMEIYVSGNIDIGGNGSINNTGVPANLMVFGTQTPSDSTKIWKLHGNGGLTGVVYAPYADYEAKGGGNGGFTSGSVVAKNIRFTGTPGPFHFDEALADLVLPFGGYSLSGYELLKNGSNGKATSAATVFGSTDYDALFKQLYP